MKVLTDLRTDATRLTASLVHRKGSIKHHSFKLNDLPHGQKYTAQICWKKPGALFSTPFHLALPPKAPRSGSIRAELEGDTVDIQWDGADGGADSWTVVVEKDHKVLLDADTSTPSYRGSVGALDNDKGYSLIIKVYSRSSACDERSSNFGIYHLVVHSPRLRTPEPPADVDMRPSDNSLRPVRTKRKRKASPSLRPPSVVGGSLDQAPAADKPQISESNSDLEYIDFPSGFASDDDDDGPQQLTSSAADAGRSGAKSVREERPSSPPPPSQDELLAKPHTVSS